jgi:hypothetical protein
VLLWPSSLLPLILAVWAVTQDAVLLMPVRSHPSSSLSLGHRPGSCLSVGCWTSRRSVGGTLPKKSFLRGPLRCCCGPSSLSPPVVLSLALLWAVVPLATCCLYSTLLWAIVPLNTSFSFFVWLWAVVPPSNFYLPLSTAPYCLFFFQVSDSICNACIAAYDCTFPPPPPIRHIHPQMTESPSSVC